MKQSNTSRYAYLAGIVDGEGCFQIKKSKRSDREHADYSLQLIIIQLDGRLMDWLYGTFGGRIHSHSTNTDGYPVYRWEVSGEKVAYLSKRMIPFLIYKKPQAELAVRFNDLMVSQRNKRSSYRAEPLKEYEREQREELFLKLKALKNEIHASAAVTTK